MGARELSIPGIAGRIEVLPETLFRGAQVCVAGPPANRQWGKVSLQRVDGSTVEAKLEDYFTRTVPSLKVGDQKYEFGDQIPLFHGILGLLPFALIVVGGGLGGLCGGLGFLANRAVIRSSQ